MKSKIVSSESSEFSLLPSFIFNPFLYLLNSLIDPVISVPPDVQNGIISLLDKAVWSINVNIILGFVPHQIGYPRYILLYFDTSISFAINGLDCLECCSL